MRRTRKQRYELNIRELKMRIEEYHRGFIKDPKELDKANSELLFVLLKMGITLQYNK